MDFPPLDLNTLLAEFVELQSDWLDDTATHVLAYIEKSVPRLRALARPATAADLVTFLADDPAFLDVCRLFLGVSQEVAAHQISKGLKSSSSWTGLRSMVRKDPAAVSEALVAAGLPDAIHAQIQKKWTVADILVDRYRLSRGRATAGQARGRSLEQKVESILERSSVPFDSRVTFVGREGKKAKCDIAIPNKLHPKIIIEAKGFEATGSKLTDFLGDISKIIDAKESRMYFFVVTDGRGWLNRRSDLRHVVQRQHDKYVDMVYTSARLKAMADDVSHILKYEQAITLKEGAQ